MARLIDRKWVPSDLTGLPRRDRTGCDYQSYVPDPIAGREFLLSGSTAADIAEAEAAIVRFDGRVSSLAGTEALARLLLRAEAVASSHIEGLVIGGRRLLRAEAAGVLGDPVADGTAAEVLNNIDAMVYAVDSVDAAVTVDGLLEMHRLLLAGTALDGHAGQLRREQNWIGGSGHNPCSASFVPPPEDRVPALMEDLCAFVNDDSLSPVTQAAIAHAQFETIHPFVDGNGRTGRALVHVVLRRRGLAGDAVPPVSLILATRARDYVAGLTAYRYVGPPGGKAAREGIDRWLATFAAAAGRAAADADRFEDRLEAVKADWRERLGPVREGSATAVLLDRLAGTPIVTVDQVAELTGRSLTAATEAIGRFERAEILTQVSVGRRNRAWEAVDVIDAFADLERALASPGGDTLAEPPTRAVPARRRRGR